MKPFMKICLGMCMCVVSDRLLCFNLYLFVYAKGYFSFYYLKCGPPTAYAGIGSGCSLVNLRLTILDYEAQGL